MQLLGILISSSEARELRMLASIDMQTPVPVSCPTTLIVSSLQLCERSWHAYHEPLGERGTTLVHELLGCRRLRPRLKEGL
jgi:hypothetical protein